FRENDHLEAYINVFRDLAMKTAGMRRPGAAALDLAWLAAGRVDGFWEFGLKPWDMAAGALLVQEAGGLVADFAGESGYLDSGRCIAGTTKVFAQLLPIVQKHMGTA